MKHAETTASQTKPATAVFRHPSRRRALGILQRTALLSWFVAMLTLGIFIAVLLPSQRAAFLANLESKARSVGASLQDIAAGAAISEDFSTIVDHCTRVLAEDPSLEFIVVTRNDGFSLIHDRQGWRSETRGGIWLPAQREASGDIQKQAGGDDIYHFARPFDYSGIQWGWIHVGLSLDAYNANVRALYQRTLLAIALGLVLGFLVSVLYARQMTRPIMRLREAVQRVAAGDLSVRAAVAARDEVGELGKSFNRMTESLLQREQILESVRFATQQFFAADDWHAVITEVLQSIGQAADVSRVYVFENHTDAQGEVVTSQRYEWVAAHGAAQIDNPLFQGMSPAAVGMGRWVPLLEAGQAVAGNSGEFTAEEQEFLEAQAIKAILVAPVHASGQWWGFIGLDECRQPRNWSEAEIASLRAAADTLGASIDRQNGRQALVLAKEAAEAANKAKSQFLANMSHEIRTPLTGVTGMLQLLHRTPLEPRQERYVSSAISAADTLLTVIGDILDFSKIEAGRMELHEKALSVPDMLDGVMQVFAAKAEGMGIELAYRVGADLPGELRGDPDRLRQVLVNLLGNAIKFTECGEIVADVRCVERGEDTAVLRFAVRDTGCGIAHAQQASIFQAFTQADGSMSRRHGGTGLGLAISRQLCELMGGTIGVESESGRGSTFWFTARLKTAAAQRQAKPRPVRSLRGLRVLVVDDCAVTREIVREYVQVWQGHAEAADDAAGGLAKLRAAQVRGEPFGVAVLDWRMPGLSGVDLARLIKADPALRGTRLVMLSGFGQALEGLAADAGLFAAALPKPARISDLYNAILMAANGDAPTAAVGPADSTLSAPVPVPGRTRGTVLLVEDNEINSEVAMELLAELGYDCIHAWNGREAVAAVKHDHPSIVLMDCQMPLMDGYEATNLLRQWEAAGHSHLPGRRLPIIALTAHAMIGDREVCLAAGMDDFLTKPIETAALAAMLAKWLPDAAPDAPAESPVTADRAVAVGADPDGGPPAADAGEPIDYPSLLARYSGKADMAERLLTKFMELIDRYVADIERALAAADAAALRLAAHSLKGAAASVSAEGIRAASEQLEQVGRAGELGPAPALLAALKAQVERLLASRVPR